eukprot:1178946-Prymnesium_polylepis.2
MLLGLRDLKLLALGGGLLLLLTPFGLPDVERGAAAKRSASEQTRGQAEPTRCGLASSKSGTSQTMSARLRASFRRLFAMSRPGIAFACLAARTEFQRPRVMARPGRAGA